MDLLVSTNQAVAERTTSLRRRRPARHMANCSVGLCEAEAAALSDGLAGAVDGSPSSRLPILIGRLLGRDFSGVRIHTGERAAACAAALGSEAFTVGRDVVFGAGRHSTPLLAHELVHVVQQGAAPNRGRAELAVRGRAPLGVQRQIDWTKLYESFCPPPRVPKSYSSSGIIGTAYGKWLGLKYMDEFRPTPYGLVDFYVWRRDSWWGGTIFDLYKNDPGVALALTNHEYTRRGLRRTDILSAELDEVYEIKPVGSAAEGPAQLADYLQQLNLTASTTSPIFGPVRPRAWAGGSGFDPTRYPLIIPAAPGKICMIHAWKDPDTQGLIVYNIVCCEMPDDDEDQPNLVDVVVKSVVAELAELKPKLEAAVVKYVRRALPGTAFALLATPPFFETFVIKKWESEQDAKLEKAYGIKPGPAFAALILESWILAHLLPTAPLSDIAYVASGFMDGKELAKIWAIHGVAGALAGLALLAAPEGAACAATVVVADELGAGAAVDTLATELAADLALQGEAGALAAGEGLAADTLAEVVVEPLIDGLDTGVAVVVGDSVAPYMVLPPAAGAGAAGAGLGGGAAMGLGAIAVALVGLLPASANADPASATASDVKTIAATPIMVAPTELVAAKRGKIELGAEVTLGDQKFFIISLAVAPKGP